MSKFFIRRKGQDPFEIPKNQVVPDIKNGKLSADDEISPDGRSWISLGKHKQLSALFKTGATRAPVPAKPRKMSEKKAGSRQDFVQAAGSDLDSGGSGFFMTKLWKGEYPLWKTFWIFGMAVPAVFMFLVMAIFFIVGMMTLSPTAESMIPVMKTYMRNFTVVLAVLLVYQFFWAVGLWRSANDYDGPGIWRTLVKIMVVFYFIGLPFNIFSMSGLKHQNEYKVFSTKGKPKRGHGKRI